MHINISYSNLDSALENEIRLGEAVFYINIHVEGKLVRDPKLRYNGGTVITFSEDLERMFYFDLYGEIDLYIEHKINVLQNLDDCVPLFSPPIEDSQTFNFTDLAKDEVVVGVEKFNEDCNTDASETGSAVEGSRAEGLEVDGDLSTKDPETEDCFKADGEAIEGVRTKVEEDESVGAEVEERVGVRAEVEERVGVRAEVDEREGGFKANGEVVEGVKGEVEEDKSVRADDEIVKGGGLRVDGEEEESVSEKSEAGKDQDPFDDDSVYLVKVRYLSNGENDNELQATRQKLRQYIKGKKPVVNEAVKGL
ncbi:hypothetical protein PTKIN_Ptkin08bG0070300 [Pterospermum kingtungense]